MKKLVSFIILLFAFNAHAQLKEADSLCLAGKFREAKQLYAMMILKSQHPRVKYKLWERQAFASMQMKDTTNAITELHIALDNYRSDDGIRQLLFIMKASNNPRLLDAAILYEQHALVVNIYLQKNKKASAKNYLVQANVDKNSHLWHIFK